MLQTFAVGVCRKTGFCRCPTADHQHILIAGILGVGRAAVHRKGFRRRQYNVVFGLGIHVRLYVLFRSPGSVLSTVFLYILTLFLNIALLPK